MIDLQDFLWPVVAACCFFLIVLFVAVKVEGQRNRKMLDCWQVAAAQAFVRAEQRRLDGLVVETCSRHDQKIAALERLATSTTHTGEAVAARRAVARLRGKLPWRPPPARAGRPTAL